MRLERREKALENRNGHRRRRQPASPSIIKRLLSREHDANAFLYAFNLLAMDGTDLRRERLDDRIWARWSPLPSAAGYSMRLNRCPPARSPNAAPDQNGPDAEMHDHGSIQRRTAIVAPTGRPISLEGSEIPRSASHAARRSATPLPPRFDRRSLPRTAATPAPTCSDARGNGSASRCGAIGATLNPPFPSKPGYAGTRTEWKNLVIYSRAADRDVPKSFIAQR